MRWQCQYCNSQGSRCPLPAVWRLLISKSDPFSIVHSCNTHVEHWTWAQATWLAALKQESEEQEKEGSD